jgi:hypothetical protein
MISSIRLPTKGTDLLSRRITKNIHQYPLITRTEGTKGRRGDPSFHERSIARI